MQEWYNHGWDIDYILIKALEWHATEVKNGMKAIIKEWYPRVKEFEEKPGYRFALSELTYPSKAAKGEAITYAMKWQNKGVALLFNANQLAK